MAIIQRCRDVRCIGLLLPLKLMIPIVISPVVVVFSQPGQGPMTGTAFTNSSISGSSSAWVTLNNAASSDNQYAGNNAGLANLDDYTDYFTASGFGFTIPTDAQIDGIVVKIEKFNTGIKLVKDKSIRIVKNGVPSGNDMANFTVWSSIDTNAIASYGAATNLWGETWTGAQINDPGFGVAISAKAASAAVGVGSPRIDCIGMTVYFTLLLESKFTSFIVTGNDASGTNLKWIVSKNPNSDYFTVERGPDCDSLYEIGQLGSVGITGYENCYEFIDTCPPNGLSYYRIMETDFDGRYQYSDIVPYYYFNKIAVKSILQVYPNPCEGEFNLLLPECRNIENHYVTVDILNADGKIINNIISAFDLAEDHSIHIQKVTGLIPGIYIAKTSYADKECSVKVIVQ